MIEKTRKRKTENGVRVHFFFQCGTPTDVEAQVLDAIEQLNGLRLMVGAGCTYPITVPVGNLLTAREAVAKA